MLRFGKSTEYALLCLMHLMEAPGGLASAREIARAHALPLPRLCKILKCLHDNELLTSERGARGGYRIAVDLSQVSVERLVRLLRRQELGDRPVRVDASGAVNRESMQPTEPPLLALDSKLRRFLQSVRLSDLLEPGRRIDVPVELIGRPPARRPVPA